MLSADQLLKLAEAYQRASGLTLSAISKRALGTTNEKTFVRLGQGFGCTSKTIDRAARWFAENWPQGVDWPKGVPAKGRLRRVYRAGVSTPEPADVAT
jgi:hypothetical protein